MIKRVEYMRLLLTPEEKQKLKELADKSHTDMSNYIRSVIFKGV